MSSPSFFSKRSVVALYSVFNVEGTLQESVYSILDAVDKVRIFDGRYTKFVCPCGETHDNSCDKTLEQIERLTREFPDKVEYVVKLPAMDEFKKRTIMLHGLASDEVGVVIDDDEIYYGGDNALRKFANREISPRCGWIKSFGIRADSIYLARVFFPNSGLHYVNYARIEDDAGVVADMIKAARVSWGGIDGLIPSARIVHLYGEGILGRPGFRMTAQREQARLAYDELIAKENGWR